MRWFGGGGWSREEGEWVHTPEALVGPVGVVCVAPLLTHGTDFVERGEEPRIEYFRAKATVQAFDVRVLVRFTGLDAAEVNAVLSRPLPHRVHQEFRAVLAAELAWPTLNGTPLLEHSDDAHARQRQIHCDGERLAFRQPLLRPSQWLQPQRTVRAVDTLVIPRVPQRPQTIKTLPEAPAAMLRHDRL